MTYTLFDWVKENVDSLLVHQSDAPFQIQVISSNCAGQDKELKFSKHTSDWINEH